eukprot:SAG11_NODE_11968_length_728_cov_1.448331_1_plen_50_part_10
MTVAATAPVFCFFSKSADTVSISVPVRSALCQSILDSGRAVQTATATKQE